MYSDSEASTRRWRKVHYLHASTPLPSSAAALATVPVAHQAVFTAQHLSKVYQSGGRIQRDERNTHELKPSDLSW